MSILQVDGDGGLSALDTTHVVFVVASVAGGGGDCGLSSETSARRWEILVLMDAGMDLHWSLVGWCVMPWMRERGVKLSVGLSGSSSGSSRICSGDGLGWS